MNRHDRLIEVLEKCIKIDEKRKSIKITQKEKEELIGLSRISLAELIKNIEKEIREQAELKKHKIYLEVDENIIVTGVKVMLTRVIKNLLSNAIKYTKENGNIKKIVKEEQSLVHVMVCDNGIGIPDIKKEKIFLYRYKDLKGKKGMGIGLSLITEIIKSYKGKIWVEDRIKGDYSKGSNFIILIPKVKDNDIKK